MSPTVHPEKAGKAPQVPQVVIAQAEAAASSNQRESVSPRHNDPESSLPDGAEAARYDLIRITLDSSDHM